MLFPPYLWRQIAELLRRTDDASQEPSAVPSVVVPETTGRVDVAKDPEAATSPPTIPSYVDNLHGFGFRSPDLYNPHKGVVGRIVPPEIRIGVCIHQTGVEFGTANSRRKVWAQRARAGECTGPDGKVLAFASDDEVEAFARRAALHERFWKVPYHVVALRNGDVLLNNRLSWYTYHGNGANKPLYGLALEGRFPGEARKRSSRHTALSPELVATALAAFRVLVLKAREAGSKMDLVLPHRVYSTKRLPDPGEEIWQRVVLPACEDLGLRPDYEASYGGKPIPNTWDEKALFDAKGRRL